MTNTEQAARLRTLADECAAGRGLAVHDLTFNPAGKRRSLIVVLDTDIAGLSEDDTTSPVEPVDLDVVAEVAREFSSRLDESGVMGESPYTLEVTSPGIGRKLESFEQFRRNVGRKVRLEWSQSSGDVPAGVTRTKDGTVSAVGRLIAASRQELVFTPDPVRSSPGAKPKPVPDIAVAFEDAAYGVVEVDFSGHEEDN